LHLHVALPRIRIQQRRRAQQRAEAEAGSHGINSVCG
jgi:hypothetical protein